MIKLYKKDGTLLRELLADDKSYRLKEVMGENAVFLYYELSEFLEVPVGAYLNFKGEYYFLRTPENFTKHHSRKWEYSLKLETWQAEAAGVKYKFFAGAHKNFKLKFPLTMSPRGFLQLFVDNMNLAGGGWSVGEALAADEKTLLFDDESCQEALVKVAQAYNTEFEYEGKTVHLRKVERTASPALPLAYGKNKGLKEGVGRINFDNTRQINRLYVLGAERNINGEKYGNPTLLLPKSATKTYSGVTYVTDAHGTYIERQGLTAARVEGSIDLTHIYPSRVGTVSEVVAVDAEKHFYDIEDSSIPADLNYTDYIIPGNEMLLKFQSGALAGIEFKVDYNHDTKRFKLHPKQEHGLTYPTAPDLPKVGDKYAIFQVQLPDNYITTASAKMLDDAAKALWEGEQTTQRVTGVLDEVYAVKNWKEIGGKIQLGQVVSFTDTQFMPNATLLRIVSIKSYLNSPKTPALQFANKVENRTFAQMLSSFKAKADGNSYSEVLKNNDRLKDIFLFKNAPDTANSHIEFKDGITANRAIADDVTIMSKLHSDFFNSGFLGEGFMLQKNKLGNWGLELDNLVVRKNMDVFRLTIQEIKSVGGQLLLSLADMRCIKVEELTNVYRCYFNNDGGEIPNLWEVGDQAICQQFSGKKQKRYWRLVVALGADYIDLSKTDTDGSGIPGKDDEIVQLGHRTNPARQNAILISSYGTPKIEQFKGIDSYSTAGKLVTRISPSGNLFRAIDFAVETADASSYLRLAGNEMEIKANVSFLPSSPALSDVKNISNTDKLNAIVEAKKLINKSEAASKTAWENYATTKANNASAAAIAAAKAYAAAEDAKKEALIKAYADGKVTALEQSQLAVIDAKTTLAKTQAQAYADNKITAEEAKRIAADKAKLAEAEKKARELVGRTEKVVDLLALDEDKYYPVTILCEHHKQFKIEVSRGLDVDYGTPSHATHYRGFSCTLKWETNGSGWGSAHIQRVVLTSTSRWHTGLVFGSIGQMTQSSQEYIYLRGGSKYNISVYGSASAYINLRTSSYTNRSQTIDVKSSVSPVPTSISSRLAAAKAASKTAWEAYATAKANNASAAAITAAKAYATAEDAKKEALIKAYSDGKITDLESKQLAVIDAKTTLAKTQAQAYADNKITAEEAARIAADKAKLAEAEKKARELVEKIKTFSPNILNGSGFEHNYGYLRASGSYADGVRTVKKVDATTSDGVLCKTFTIPEKFVGKELTFSIEVSATWNIKYYLFARNLLQDGSLLDGNVSNTLLAENPTFGQLSSVTFTPVTSTIRLYVYTRSSVSLSLLGGFMLTEGNRAVRWQASEADVAAERDKKITDAKNALHAQLAAAKAALNAGIDEIGKKTNFLTKSIIDPNHAVIGTGALLLGNENGANTCLTGLNGNNPNAVTISSGSTYANRGSAPFRVTAGGDVYSERSFIKGHIEATSGSFEGYLKESFSHLSLERGYNGTVDLSTSLNLVVDVEDGCHINLPKDLKYNGATCTIVNHPRNQDGILYVNSFPATKKYCQFKAVPALKIENGEEVGYEVYWLKIKEISLDGANWYTPDTPEWESYV